MQGRENLQKVLGTKFKRYGLVLGIISHLGTLIRRLRIASLGGKRKVSGKRNNCDWLRKIWSARERKVLLLILLTGYLHVERWTRKLESYGTKASRKALLHSMGITSGLSDLNFHELGERIITAKVNAACVTFRTEDSPLEYNSLAKLLLQSYRTVKYGKLFCSKKEKLRSY